MSETTSSDAEQSKINEEPVQEQSTEASPVDASKSEQKTDDAQNQSDTNESTSEEEPQLTDKLWLKVFSFLGKNELANVQQVSKQWLELGRSDVLWKELHDNTEWNMDFGSTNTGKVSFYDIYRIRSEIESEKVEYFEEDLAGEMDEIIQGDNNQITPEKLKDMLNTDEFVVALQKGEENVLLFLEDPFTILAMISIIFTEPRIENDIQRQRVTHIAIQTLISGIITDILILDVNRHLLDYLFDILETLDPETEDFSTKTDCFAKIITTMFEKFPAEMITYLQSRERFIPTLLLFCQDANLMEMLYKFVDCDATHQWLADSELITRLITFLHPDESFEVQESAVSVLTSILASCQAAPHSVLVADLLNNEAITRNIIGFMEHTPLQGESIKLGVRVLISIINLISDELEESPAVVSILTTFISFFTRILSEPQSFAPIEEITLTTGSLHTCFGFVRLAVLELLVSLLYTGFPVVVEGMLQENLFPAILDLLFQYPWNNIAHQQISQLFSGLFCCNNFDVIQQVLVQSRLPERIAEAHATADQRVAGYLGYLRELSNELIKISKQSEQIATCLAENESWTHFSTNQLQELNRIEGVRQDAYEFNDELDQFDPDGEYYEQMDEYEIVEGSYDMFTGHEDDEYGEDGYDQYESGDGLPDAEEEASPPESADDNL